MTVKSDRQNSPVLSGDRPIAAKAMMATTVAPSSGVDVWPVTSRAASSASIPPLIRTNMPSMITIALSTSMPSAMISAPSEMRSRATPAGPHENERSANRQHEYEANDQTASKPHEQQ